MWEWPTQMPRIKLGVIFCAIVAVLAASSRVGTPPSAENGSAGDTDARHLLIRTLIADTDALLKLGSGNSNSTDARTHLHRAWSTIMIAKQAKGILFGRSSVWSIAIQKRIQKVKQALR